MKIRKSARIILLDETNRIFLFCFTDTYNPEIGEFWVTPGGGVDDGESFEDAVKRELWEETGIETGEIGPWIWTREAQFNWEDDWITSHERYFLVRLNQSVSIHLDNFTQLEKDNYRSHKWWEIEELAKTNDLIFPRQLVPKLREVLNGNIPPEPINID